MWNKFSCKNKHQEYQISIKQYVIQLNANYIKNILSYITKDNKLTTIPEIQAKCHTCVLVTR
jgi:hypothetical protein